MMSRWIVTISDTNLILTGSLTKINFRLPVIQTISYAEVSFRHRFITTLVSLVRQLHLLYLKENKFLTAESIRDCAPLKQVT